MWDTEASAPPADCFTLIIHVCAQTLESVMWMSLQSTNSAPIPFLRWMTLQIYLTLSVSIEMSLKLPLALCLCLYSVSIYDIILFA